MLGSWLSTIIRAGGGQAGNALSNVSEVVFNTKKDPANSHPAQVAPPAPAVVPTLTTLDEQLIVGGAFALGLVLLLRKPAARV